MYVCMLIYILYIYIYVCKLDDIYIPLSISKKMWKTHGETNPMAHQSGR